MPRQARKKSGTGYLHIIVRGNNKQILFEDDEDHKYFIRKVGIFCREAGIRVNAFCMMENHVHLLVNDPQDQAGKMMHRLETAYSFYINGKYERVGHVFQGRFLSEPVENEAYLLTVFRYILNNPRKAGICPAEKYRWSSYKAYFREKTALDLGFVKAALPTGEIYKQFIGEENDDECLEHYSSEEADARALETIRYCLGVTSGTKLQEMGKKDRDIALRKLKEKGLSIRQIERLTGISRNIIQRA